MKFQRLTISRNLYSSGLATAPTPLGVKPTISEPAGAAKSDLNTGSIPTTPDMPTYPTNKYS